ncbi:hypothetical protein V8C37DRAFT_412419 [Trichoderma ceciliae]
MASKVSLDLKLLQSSASGGQVAYLRHVLINDPAAASQITSQLISHVASDVLPPIVLSLWAVAANEPHVIVAIMRQELCLGAQRSAIGLFYRHLRRDKTFAKAWEAVGGATGTAQLVAKLNVDNVRLLFSLLGATGRAIGARKERQSAMEELLRLLWGDDEEAPFTGDEHVAFDSRPLRHEYAKLVPACGGALRLEWEEMKRLLPNTHVINVATDPEFFEHYYNGKLRRSEITVSEFLYKVKPLISNRTDYGLHILEKFAESETLLGASPNAFLEREAFRKNFVNSGEHYRRIVLRIVKAWNHSRAQAEYTEALTMLLSLVPEATHAAGHQFDIGEPASLDHTELQSTSFRWPVDVFFVLSADEALPLLEKLQRAGKDVGSRRIWYRGQFLYDERDEDDGELADRHIVRALLLRAPGRQPEIRARWGVSTLSLCMAIGDLNLYAETLRWARRFNKDPLAVKEMYSRQCLSRKEGVDLLTVLPTTSEVQSAITVEELAKSIHSANEILQILYETAVMSTNEPSFSYWDWQATFDLINRVVQQRLSRVDDFQDRSKISDSALYEALWQPTSAMLEKMISNLLGPVGKNFGPMNPYTVISKLQVDKPETLRGPTVKFLDALAVFQNTIWTELRTLETPAIVTADEIWPKGLTIQHLYAHFGQALAYLPYAQSRIEGIVFIDPHKALEPIQVDEETQAAIGKFVDSWSKALHLYIGMPDPKEHSQKAQRQERITRAWRHATVNLSKDRMSPEEAERFWWPVFRRVDVELREVGIGEEKDERSEPSLPDVDEDMQPIEWNPDPDYDRISQPAKDKTLTATCLDVLISQPNAEAAFSRTKTSVFGDVKAVILGKPRPSSFWDSSYSMNWKLTGKGADAYATAGILALNMKYGSDISLLKTPFPDANAVRIPAVYLDQEFLEREADKYAPDIVNMVARLIYYVPAGLLVQLATSVLESIRKKPEAERPYSIFVQIIRIILDGTNPSLGFPLIQQFVLENPDASSWNRLLLNPRGMITLLPSDAKSFFESFTDAILDKLQEQADRRAKEPDEPDAPARKGPLVKVTTVKMLAQLLRECPVVDPSLAVDLNTRILKRAAHVDRILDALLKYAAPIASSINEAQPFTDWEALTPDDELPEVWEDGTGNLINPPIMNLLMSAGPGIVWLSDEGQALKELKNSVLDSSAENNRRWMNLFLKKHGFSVPDNVQFPAVPVFPTALDTLLTMMKSETSLKHIDLMKQYVLLRLAPPDWLSLINKAVKEDQKLSRSSAGKHWHNLWSSDGVGFMTNLILTISEYLHPECRTTQGDARSRAFHQASGQFLFEIADAILMRAQPSEFRSFLSNTSAIGPEWPVWERILDRINSIRTPAWQADSNRKPAVLPDTLALKIRMLNLPHKSSSNPDEAKATVAKCANGVVELLNEFASSGSPYFHGLSTLQKELETIEPLAEMAILLGSPPASRSVNNVTLVDHLCVELAVGMLSRSNIFTDGFGKPHDEGVVKEAKRLVMRMSSSYTENFRTLSALLKGSIENGYWA